MTRHRHTFLRRQRVRERLHVLRLAFVRFLGGVGWAALLACVSCGLDICSVGVGVGVWRVVSTGVCRCVACGV